MTCNAIVTSSCRVFENFTACIIIVFTFSCRVTAWILWLVSLLLLKYKFMYTFYCRVVSVLWPVLLNLLWLYSRLLWSVQGGPKK